VNKIIRAVSGNKAKRICGVEILVGELSLLGSEQFAFWVKEMLKLEGEIASEVEIDLKPVEAIIKCKQCGYKGGLKPKEENHFSPGFFCPACNQGDIVIEQGRECVLNKIQIEK